MKILSEAYKNTTNPNVSRSGRKDEEISSAEDRSRMGSQQRSTSGLICITILFVLLVCVTALSYGGIASRNDKNQNHFCEEADSNCNLRPIIGILAQEYYAGTKPPTPANFSYIPASYVKFVEGAGARVIPIMINQNSTYYDTIFSKINGILFPGGGVDFDTSGFGKAGKYLYNLTKSANDKGDFFPLWGTCMGFEFLVYNAVGGHDVLVNCDAQNVTNKLKFTKDSMDGKLFGSAPKQVIKLLESKELTANFHHRCLTNEIVKSYSLEQQMRILSWNFDKPNQIKYVSSFEFTKYPFFGVQFHPEKNIYEWSRKEGLPHSAEGIQVAQYFAQFFVENARRNLHTFSSDDEENDYLIYNYDPVFTGKTGTFEQSYLFPL